MNQGGRAAFWLAVIAVPLLALWLLSDVLLPFALGLALAYLLDPVVMRLESLGIRRGFAALLVITLFFLVVIVAGVALFPVLQRQIVGLAAALVEGANDLYARVYPLIESAIMFARERGGEVPSSPTTIAGDLVGKLVAWLGSVLAGLWSGGLALFHVLSLVFITPVVAFYMMRDWPRIIATIESWLPRDHAATITDLVRQMDQRIAGFLRGQALVCLFLAVFYAVGLTIVGLDHGLVVGLLTGGLSFIPYVGMLVGMATGMLIAFFQYDEWSRILIVLGVFLLGQIIEGNFVSPKLVGDRVGLHPVWIMLALVAGGALFGFTGVLLAVPVAASIGVLSRFALMRYRESSLHRGNNGLPASGDAKRDA